MRDVENMLCESQAFSADAVSENTYDTGKAGGIDISTGEPMAVVINVETAAKISGGTETYAFELIQSAAENLSSPDVLNRIDFDMAVDATTLTKGKVVVLPVPQGSITKRYLGLNFDGDNTPTITVSAYLVAVKDIGIQKYPARAYSVTTA